MAFNFRHSPRCELFAFGPRPQLRLQVFNSSLLPTYLGLNQDPHVLRGTSFGLLGA